MPIDLLNMTPQAVPQNKYTPKFFDKKLTGNSFGGNSGVINHFAGPNEFKLSDFDIKRQDYLLHGTDDNSCEMHRVFNTIGKGNTKKDTYDAFLPYDKLELSDMTFANGFLTYHDLEQDKLGEWTDLGDHKIKMRLIPYRVRIHEKKNALVDKWNRSLTTAYQLQFLLTDDPDNFVNKADEPLYNKGCDALFDSDYKLDLTDNLPIIIDDFFQVKALSTPLSKIHPNQSIKLLVISTINPKAVFEYISNANFTKPEYNKYQLDFMGYLQKYNLYNAICSVSESFQTNLMHFVETAFRIFDVDDMSKMYRILQNIYALPTPLNSYFKMYEFFNKVLKNEPTILDTVVNSNLNFIFNDLLLDLGKHKSSLEPIPVHNKVDDKLSLEQQQAVKSENSLTLVEAGAGTGKSSVLLSRIKYLMDGGVNQDDILVLSFTNAAAQHINQLYPKVKSMTINSLVNQIYQANYCNQMIVLPKTFYNSLVIEYGNKKHDDFMTDFFSAINMLSTDSNDDKTSYLDAGFQLLIKLLKQDPKRIIDICTKLGQTTFDLQIAIDYVGFDKLTLPKEILAKHILVDEVQDNSTFDFMFLLRYVIEEKSSFFIVGDASQTLYAFRNANPYALNILRTSNLFSIFQLTTNFRSKQEILTYANSVIDDITANMYANIHLKANSLIEPTVAEFRDTVRIDHYDCGTQGTVKTMTDDQRLIKYVKECLKRGEKVTFLSFSHATLFKIQSAMQEVFGSDNQNTFVDISSKRANESNIFSSFWANLSDDYRKRYAHMQPNNLLHFIKLDLVKLEDSSTYQEYAMNQWDQLMANEGNDINALTQNYITQKITFNKYLKQLIGIMVRYEITHNRLMQQARSNDNRPELKQQKIDSSNFIFSTIHSAKGLEFDNVVLFIDQSSLSAQTSQSDLRACYVGLTRAKKTEYIIQEDSYTADSCYTGLKYQYVLNGFK